MAYIDVKKKKTKNKLSHLRSDHFYLYTTETDVGCEAVPHNDNLPKKAQFTVDSLQNPGPWEEREKLKGSGGNMFLPLSFLQLCH